MRPEHKVYFGAAMGFLLITAAATDSPPPPIRAFSQNIPDVPHGTYRDDFALVKVVPIPETIITTLTPVKVQPTEMSPFLKPTRPEDLPQIKPGIVYDSHFNPISEVNPEIKNNGFQWPTYGPIFAWFSPAHQGLDIAPSYGTPVFAAGAGIATIGRLRYDYGNHIIIYHPEGYQTIYAHLSSTEVASEQKVDRGQLIGRVGMTGYASGPHLHFEVRKDGAPINPLNVLPR